MLEPAQDGQARHVIKGMETGVDMTDPQQPKVAL